MNLHRRTLSALALLLLVPGDAAAQRGAGLFPTGSQRSLNLVRYDVTTHITHPVARTTVTQEFENPTARALEAYFYYRVPPAATLNDLALWVNGVRRPARVLERQRAREIYQGIVNKKRDPALVERLRGNLFRIRIFPIPARRRTRVQLSFVEPVERRAAGRYRFTLRKPPGDTVHALRFGLHLEGVGALAEARLQGYPSRLRRREKGYHAGALARRRSLAEDIVLDYRLAQPQRRGLAQGVHGAWRYLVAEVPTLDKPPAPTLTVLLDASASMKTSLPRARVLLRRLIGELPPGSGLQLSPFDLLPRPSLAVDALTKANKAKLMDRLDEIEARRGGAFVPAFEHALRGRGRHIVLVTDGAAAGHQAELEAVMRELHDHRTQGRQAMVSVILLDPKAPTADILRDISRVSGGAYLPLPGLQGSAKELTHLAQRRAPLLPHSAQGSVELLRGGQRCALIAARIPRDATALTLRLGAKTLNLSLAAPRRASDASNPRALWAAARIDRLYRKIKLFGEDEAQRRRIVALSQEHRVASEYTAFLVTETDKDYQRPTSGRVWQREVRHIGDGTPSFHSTPEPHEWLLIGLGLLIVTLGARRKRASRTAL